MKSYDLTREIPPDVTLSGLSTPKFDGVNYFRQPLGQRSEIRFKTADQRFVQLEYQLYSPESDLSGQVVLDGKPIGWTNFPAGTFAANAVAGNFVEAGDHRLSLTYTCVTPCLRPPSQYWTKLTVVDDANMKAREDTGPGAERLWLDAPGSELKITGTGSVSFDGVNYRRPVEAQSFTLSWPAGKQPLNLGFTVNATQPFRVTTRVGDAVLMHQRGAAMTSMSPTLSLVEYPEARAVTVQVDCLAGGSPCALLYLPVVSVLSPAPFTQNLALAIPASLLLLLAAALLLGVFPDRRTG